MNILHKVTAKILKYNKVRTGVTIIGILLSAAMFTAVTTCVSSVQNFLFRTTVATDGNWHGVLYNADFGDRYTLLYNNGKILREEIEGYTSLDHIGYAMAGSTNEYKPYLMVYGVDSKVEDYLPIHLTDGRMPQNSGEILLPAHLQTNGEVEHQLGETLVLTLGERRFEGALMNQQNPYQPGEELIAKDSRVYTVVGFYRRPRFEQYYSPGYSALTVADSSAERADIYLRTKNPRDIYALLEGHESSINSNLMRYTGMSNEGSYNEMLYGLAAILMGIICFGSIALIYNAFSISVSERTKQFGVLKTIGATKRQLRGSVLYEALLLSAVGIPLGVGAGVLGIFITLQCTDDLFAAILENYEVSLRLYVTPAGVAIAVAVCLITVLIAAWIPAARAIRQNAIESVRQSGDISIRAGRIKSPRWVYKLFGFEGMLSDKNFKRNRKKYRATVASLFVSVVLFISASSFCSYLTRAGEAAIYAGRYELSYFENQDIKDREGLRREMAALPLVEEVAYDEEVRFNILIEEENLHQNYLNYRAEYERRRKEECEAVGEPYQFDEMIGANHFFLDDETFCRWAESQGLDPQDYLKEPLGIAVDQATEWDYDGQKQMLIRYLKGEETEYILRHIPDRIEGYYYKEPRQKEDGTLEYVYQNDAGEMRLFSEKDERFHLTRRIGAVVKEDPFGTNRSSLYIIYPMSMFDRVMEGTASIGQIQYRLKTDAPSRAAEQLKELLQNKGLETKDTIYNRVEGSEGNRALIIIINVFSYGFIVLISLIALANVFNTVSTNIALRRREFAMLRSVGMTERGLNKMMNYECILYGVKGLSSGLIAAVAVTWLIYRTVNAGVVTDFYIPWYSVAIAVGSVFLVVFSTMLYSMGKIKKEDPIEALKNENI